MSQPKLKILYTGGTLGMAFSGSGGLIPDVARADLAHWVPEMKQLASIDVEVVANIDSSEATPELWLELAKRIELLEAEGQVHGVLVIHGTDTLAYTASALSFLLPSLRLPVVLTGSQRPLSITRTDARNNIVGAVETCLYGPREVMVFFRDTAFRANRVTKRAVSDFNAFESPNFPALGLAGIDWSWRSDLFWPESRRPALAPDLPQTLPSPPLVLPWVPGMNPDVIAPLLSRSWALILEGFGSGNLPVTDALLTALSGFQKQNGLVLVRSQVSTGKVDLRLYEPGCRLEESGVISAHDMTREALVTKLMVLKSLGFEGRKLQAWIGRSIAGELSEPSS